jgi:hypothetical protein
MPNRTDSILRISVMHVLRSHDNDAQHSRISMQEPLQAKRQSRDAVSPG